MPSKKLGPSFKTPPVAEVVVGIQFEAIEGWMTSHYGMFWKEIKDEYPKFDDLPPAQSIQLLGGPPPRISFGPLPPLRRVHYIHISGNFLMQVQGDRFLLNWRRVDDSDIYPRFDAIFDTFNRQWNRFILFLESVGLPAPKPAKLELTYLNHLGKDGDQFPRDTWNYLAFYDSTPKTKTRTVATALSLQIHWPLKDNLGTVFLDVKHGETANDKQVLVIELTARGTAEGSGLVDWFAHAHEAIVNTFDELTTDSAHQLWGKE